MYNIKNPRNNKSKYSTVIYVLSITLSLLLCYIALNTMKTASTLISDSKIILSPLNGERIKPTLSNNNPVEVTYTTSENTVSLNGISNAEIVYEYVDKNGQPFYKALFAKDIPSKTKPITSIDVTPLRTLPKLSFIDLIDVPSDYTRSAKSIFVTLSYNVFSNFIYEDGQYSHYRDTYKDIDKSTFKPITVSNVIVQFVHSNIKIDSPYVNGTGKGLLFRGGKVIDIKWDKQKNKPIKILDEEGKPVSLVRGKTWWIILHENSSVAYD